MSATVRGPRTWTMSRDDEGHRTYEITHRVVTTDPLDGPYVILQAPGLPIPGAVWAFDNDYDPWAWCRPTCKVKQILENEPNYTWDVTSTFSTKPVPKDKQRCTDTQVEDPLLEPQKVSGSFVKYTKEASFDRHGAMIRNSSYEQFRGSQNEWDANRATVKIEQNVAALGLATFTAMIDTLNDATLWGVATRCIKLSNVQWERKFHGSCELYYTRTLEFDIDFETFDRDLMDEGTKALNGHWDPTTGLWTLDNINGVAPVPTNPTHYKRYKDKNGENTRVILNGAGLPLTDGASPVSRHVEKYSESNFLALGIPVIF